MRTRALALLLLSILLAGCTQVDSAKAQLAEAQREAEEAKGRYERVRSATVVRDENLRVVVGPMSNETEIWFSFGVWRGDVALPLENLTALPPLRLRMGAHAFTCDPLTCRANVTGEDVNVTWADGVPGGFVLKEGRAACVGEGAADAYCGFPQMERMALVRVTTALSDATV